MDYLFSKNWFDSNKTIWRELLRKVNPTRILEIGSYEGKSTTFIVECLGNINDLEIHCIDSWEGGTEHRQGEPAGSNMREVEARFEHNMKIAINKSTRAVKLEVHRGLSKRELPKLVANGMQGYFDFIYIDGSHQAPDVLLDAILGFELLRKGGVMAFDDYLWEEELSGGTDPIRCPKISIDAFTNIYCRKVKCVSAPLKQLYVEKVSN